MFRKERRVPQAKIRRLAAHVQYLYAPFAEKQNSVFERNEREHAARPVGRFDLAAAVFAHRKIVVGKGRAEFQFAAAKDPQPLVGITRRRNVGYSWGIIRVGSLLPTRFSFPHAILMRFNPNRIVAN